MAFVPTRNAAIALFLLATAGYWFAALGWPLAKGRDSWDYLAYYLQLFDSNPPLDSLQLFRTPLTPLVLGVPMDIGGTVLLEVVLGVLYAVSIVAWSATALTFGRVPALLSALLLLVYPAYATLYHQASSDAIFATGLALWSLGLARALRRPSGWGFAALGAGIGVLVLIRPANQVLLPIVLLPLLVPTAWRKRLAWSAAAAAAAIGLVGAWAVTNGIRYDDTTVARGGRAWVPFLRVFLADKTVSPENGDASRRLARLIEDEVLAKEPHAGLRVPLAAYLENGSNYETVRLIALSDRVYGTDENYDVLFDSALEAIREHPGTYLRGVADAFWEFLRQAPLREDVGPREQTAPEAPPPTFEADGVTLPNPQAHVLVEAVPYGFVWCASDYIDSCTLDDPSVVWADRETTSALSRDRESGSGLGRRSPRTRGRRHRHGAPESRHATLSPPPVLARPRARRARLPAPARLAGRRRALDLRRARAPRPCGLPGRDARVRAPALSRVHRDGARRAPGGSAPQAESPALQRARRLASFP